MKKLWNARKDSEGVSPVIATILMVAITVVLAAILMVMVMGMTGGSAPTATINAVGSEADDKVNVTVSFISAVTPQSDFTFTIAAAGGGSVSVNSVDWSGTSTDVVSGSMVQLSVDPLTSGTIYTVQMLYNGSPVATTTFNATA
jgi:flagellin-like protein